MFKNYFKIAWRNLRKNKIISFINIFGLTISISICLLISLFIYDEMSYDKFQKDYDKMYRLELVFKNDKETKHWAATPPTLGGFVERKFSEIEHATRLMPSARTSIVIGEKKFKEENCFLADPTIFNVLGLTLLQGNPVTALKDPHSVVLSEKTAKKLFGSTDVLNKSFAINNYPLKVTGILKDIPSNSHLQVNILRSINVMTEAQNPVMNSWISNILYTYVKVKPGTDINRLTDKLAEAFVTEGVSRDKESFRMKFHQVAQMHLDGNVEKELTQNSNRIFIYIFVTVGLLILLLASINYINLTTSRSLSRAKEIGVRKTLGAYRKNLVSQFLSESVFITFVSFAIAVFVVYAGLPGFNSITGKTLSMSSLFSPFQLCVSVIIILFIGLLAGIYPAFVISSFDPISAIKGVSIKESGKNFSFGLRKGLVIFQFVISAFLVISSLVVIDQISYMFNKPMGYDKENVMVLPVPYLSHDQLNEFKTELAGNTSILNISATSAVPGKRVVLEVVNFEGDQQNDVKRTLFVDHNYLTTLGMKIVKGRNFNPAIISDTSEAVIINEAAVRQAGWKDAIGKKVDITYANKTKQGRVIGVVKDFHQGSLHNTIEPTIIHLDTWYEQVVVKYKAGELDKVKGSISLIWDRLFPNDLLSYSFLEEDLKTLYKPENTLKQLLIVFTVFAIVIASLGLFGLIYFTNTLKKKEISIRKVLGASSKSIIYLLSKEYIILIGISLLISVPLSGYALNKWLANFAYRIDISVLTILTGIMITLVIAFITVVMQGLKAALSNPVNNIRTE